MPSAPNILSFGNPILFWGALIVKVIAVVFLGPLFQAGGYVTFLNYYVSNNFANPYTFFYEQGELSLFPYPRLMLIILSIPSLIFGPLLNSPLIYRLPILLADLVILGVLIQWLRGKEEKVLKYYWCSPILFYINYLVGQLDAIPIMFLFLFLYWLFKEEYLGASLSLGLALAAKTGLVIILPFVFVYWLKERLGLGKAILLVAVPVALFLLINFDYLRAPGFFEIAFNPPGQLALLNFQYKLGGELIIYFLPIAYLALFARSWTFRSYNQDLFLMFLGFALGIIALFVPPLPGWYYWMIPFLIYFYVKQENAALFPFFLLNVFYLVYFLTSAGSPLVEGLVIPAVLRNIIFSLLQASLLFVLIWVYRQGIESQTRFKMKYRPYFIGIAGDSGSGKSVVAELLGKLFGDKNTLVVAGDDLHKWERDHLSWQSVTHLNPRASRLQEELENLIKLNVGRGIFRQFYDHVTGRFSSPHHLLPKKVIIFEGLHSLYLGKFRRSLDLKMFLEPKEELRRHWKIRRDMKERGHTQEQIVAQIEEREQDAIKYIRRQKLQADLVVSFNNREPLDPSSPDLAPPLFLELVFDAAINIEPLVDALQGCPDLRFDHYYEGERQHLEFHGRISSSALKEAASNLFPEMPEITRVSARFENDYNGLLQLFIGYHIFYKMRIEHYA